MGLTRKIKQEESKLLFCLLRKAKIDIQEDLVSKLLIIPLTDGGMGSLRLLPNGVEKKNAKFGKQVSDFEFKDADGIIVIASLYLDQDGDLFELDIWKTNFERVIQIPNL